MSRSDRRRAARARHAAAEREAFKLRPWETCPCNAGGDPPAPGDTTMRAQSWHRARELRDKLLEADPHRYDDLEADDSDDEADDEPDGPLPRAAWAPDGSGWMQDPDRKDKR